MKKRVLATLLALCMVLGVMPGGARAEDIDGDGDSAVAQIAVDQESAESGVPTGLADVLTYGNLTYRITADNTIAIVRCDENAVSIQIPAQIDGMAVTSITRFAFGYCEDLAHITVPSSVTSIEDLAFFHCDKLTSAGPIGGEYSYEFGWTESIPEYAFSFCEGLVDVDIPTGITSIGDSAFLGCTSLQSIDIPSSVISIGTSAFSGCSKLTSVELPSGITSIGTFAFSSCSGLTHISIPEEVTQIEYGLFDGCSSLETINIPSTITSIRDSAFRGCKKLLSIDIPDSVTKIGSWAFYDCDSLTSINIPDRVTDIGWSAFRGCDNLASITIPNSVTRFFMGPSDSSNDIGHVFGSPKLKTVGPIGGDYDIQFGWTEAIPDIAFRGCVITDVTIPSGITRIGDGAFGSCPNLTNITIPNTVTSIGNNVFQNDSSLTAISIPNSVAAIGGAAFRNCTNLKSIALPDRITDIETETFYLCYNLTSIIIPSSVTHIGRDAFAQTGLTDVYYAGNEEDWLTVDIDQDEGHGNGGNTPLLDATIHYNSTGPDDVSGETVSGILRSGDDWKIRWKCSYKEDAAGNPSKGSIEITVNDTNTTEELYLYDDTGLTGFPWEREPYNIPKSAIETLVIRGKPTKKLRLTANSFQGYTGLKTVVFDFVSGVDSYAFEGCTLLERVGFLNEGSGFTAINNGAFRNCTSLTKMDFSGSLQRIGAEAFRNTALGTITLGTNLIEIGKNAFTGCGDVLIRCTENSVAHQYAVENNIPFELIGDISYTPFVMGQDQWSFSNSGKYFTSGSIVDGHYTETYFLTDDDYGTLIKSLNKTEKENVDECKDRYWGGSCYGMSVVAILSKAGLIAPSNIQVGKESLYSIAKSNNDRVESFINFYYLQQCLAPSMNDRNRFTKKSTLEQLQMIEEKVLLIPTTNTPVLLAFSGDEGGHAVVACDVEHGEFTLNDGFLGTTWGGRKFDSRIVIYDCNYPEGSELSYLYYNRGTDDWCIPNYSWATKLIMACNAPYVMSCGYAQIASYAEQENGDFGSTAWLDYDGEADGYFMEWKDSTLLINSSTDRREDGLATYYDANVTLDETSNPGPLHLTLPDPTANYSVKPTGTDSGFKLSYENSSLSIACETADRITFDPSGKIETEGISGSYSAGMVFNDGYHSLPWYKTFISGMDGGNLALMQTEGGILIEGSNLHDIVVTVQDDDGTQNLRFSTEEESALLTYVPSDSGMEPVITLDSNNDGIYDEAIGTIYTITFNPNGGTVSTTEITTGTDGKLLTLPTPTRTGYAFAGWFTLPSGGTAVTTDTVFSNNATVYAQWTYNGGGGSTGSNNWIPSDNTGSSPSGSSSATSHSITTPSVAGGTITVSPKSATKGSTVTITVTPDAGYTLASLIVKDNIGKAVELTDKGNGKYTFVMPESKITIKASFQLTQHTESSTEPTPWNNPFADVSAGAWYYDAVEFVSGNGLMNGVSTNTFAPDANLSRAMLAQILYNKEGQPVTTTNGVFTDVANNAWYADAVAWAAANRIVNGYGDALFGPEDNITREHFAVMLWRYEKEPAATISELHFSDAGEISNYALDAMRWAIENGIINGKGDGILDPCGLATRAQVAQMLKNYLRK